MNFNPRDMAKAMKRLGISQQEIPAQEVIIRCEDKEIIITNPSVTKVNLMGQDTLQITGTMTERMRTVAVNADDIHAVMEQTTCDEKTAKEALERNNGDIAKSILELSTQ